MEECLGAISALLEIGCQRSMCPGVVGLQFQDGPHPFGCVIGRDELVDELAYLKTQLDVIRLVDCLPIPRLLWLNLQPVASWGRKQC